MSYTDIKLNEETVTQIALADGTILWKKPTTKWTGLTYTNVDTTDGNMTITISSSATSLPNIEYSTDGSTWITPELAVGTTTSVPVAVGASIYLRGINSTYFTTPKMDVKYKASGNILSMVNYNNMDTRNVIPTTCSFFFSYHTKLVDASELNFGNATTIDTNGCMYMFRDAELLEKAPDLSNIKKVYGNGCMLMYVNCYKLQTLYTPNVSSWNTSQQFNMWVSGAGSKATSPLIMYAPSQTVADLIPSGTNGYGNYTVKVIGADDPITVTITASDDVYTTYQIDSEDAVTVSAGSSVSVTLPSTATNITMKQEKSHFKTWWYDIYNGSTYVKELDDTYTSGDTTDGVTIAISDLADGYKIECGAEYQPT